MTYQKERHVTVEENFVRIRESLLKESETLKYFKDLPKGTDYDQKLEELVKLGVVISKIAGTTQDVNLIEREFQGFLLAYKKLQDEALDENSTLLKDHLDMHKEGSAFHTLAAYLTNELEKLKAVTSESLGGQKALQNTTKKGGKFEDEFKVILEDIAAKFGDIVEETKNKTGKLTGCKTGDFVHLISELKKTLVWELKDYDSDLRMPVIQKNLDEGLENREGDIIILAATNKNALPPQIGWFKEVKPNQLVIALGDGQDKDLYEVLVHIAYMWARAKILLLKSKDSKIDSASIQQGLANIAVHLKTFESIKRQCTNLNKASGEIETLSTDAKDKIKKELDELLKSLK